MGAARQSRCALLNKGSRLSTQRQRSSPFRTIAGHRLFKNVIALGLYTVPLSMYKQIAVHSLPKLYHFISASNEQTTDHESIHELIITRSVSSYRATQGPKYNLGKCLDKEKSTSIRHIGNTIYARSPIQVEVSNKKDTAFSFSVCVSLASQ